MLTIEPDFQPCNSKVLATHKVVVDSFRDLYPLNKNATAPNAVAVGRYPEDTYFGGNPWYLCTLACAELLYDAVAQLNTTGSLTIDQYSLPFFQDIYPSATKQTYNRTAMTPILEAMRTYGDGFVQVVQVHIHPSVFASFLLTENDRPTCQPTAPCLSNSTKPLAIRPQPTTSPGP
jgi:glucoamylase